MAQWKDNGLGWEAPPTGNHVARCVRVIEIGTRTNEWQGKTRKRRECMIVWELPTELNKDNEPFTISKFYTSSLSEKANLRHDLENWRGRPFTPQELEGFDQVNILGKPCLLNVIKNEKGKVVVGSVAAIPKGMTVPAQHNESLFYDVDNHDEDAWNKLSDGIKAMINDTDERKGVADMNEDDAPDFGGHGSMSDDSEIPF